MNQTTELKKPEWVRIRLPVRDRFFKLKSEIQKTGIATVCEEAHCPNISECWSGGTATFMLMGDTCTRGCRFCSVSKAIKGRPLNPNEPNELAGIVGRMGLSYVVLTSVDRDDLEDQGSSHFAKCVMAIKEKYPEIVVEVLIPDFRGEEECIRMIIESGAEVIAHNIETVERLQKFVRDRRAGYWQSIDVLKTVKRLDPKIYTKTSLMLGLGEEDGEILKTMNDLRAAGVDIITFGQYLRPTHKQVEVSKYVAPEKFDYYKQQAEALGFLYCASGPFVRSSYRAGELFMEHIISKKRIGKK